MLSTIGVLNIADHGYVFSDMYIIGRDGNLIRYSNPRLDAMISQKRFSKRTETHF